jgi:hypothetical protein
MGIAREEFLARFPAMTPRDFGDKVISVLHDAQYAGGLAFGINGDGITILEEAAA